MLEKASEDYLTSGNPRQVLPDLSRGDFRMKFVWNLRILLRNSAEYVRVSANLHKTEIDWAMLGKLCH